MTDHYRVVGNPISQSKSPWIHAAFAQQTEQDLVYDSYCPEREGFSAHASAFFANGAGMNVTAPYKLDAFEFAHQLTDRARLAGAVNTLKKQQDGSILGDNTDGYGLVSDISENLRWPLAGQRVLVLGAGGAVRGVLGPLLQAEPESLTLANRTLAKAEALARLFTDAPISCCELPSLAQQPAFDLVINATSAGLAGAMPALPEGFIGPATRVYDMTYGAEPTPFLCWAQEQGSTSLADGLGMLVGQAAEAFFVWRGIRPQVAPVLEALRRQLQSAS